MEDHKPARVRRSTSVFAAALEGPAGRIEPHDSSFVRNFSFPGTFVRVAVMHRSKKETHMKKQFSFVGFTVAVAVMIVALNVATLQNVAAGQGAPKAAPAATPPSGPNLPAAIKTVGKESRCLGWRAS